MGVLAFLMRIIEVVNDSFLASEIGFLCGDISLKMACLRLITFTTPTY